VAVQITRLWVFALVAGLVAGLESWVGGEAAYGHYTPVFKLPANWDRLGPYDKPNVISDLLREATPIAEAKNTAVAYGLLGASLGAALGLAGGLARRSAGAALAATLFGAVAGVATGAGMSVVLTHEFYRRINPESGMMLGMLTHAGIWVPVGAVAGLAFGLGLGGPRAIAFALLGGLAGAVFGTMAFETINAIAFPLIRVNAPIPGDWLTREEAQKLPRLLARLYTGLPRLLSCLCVAVFTALGAAVGVRRRGGKPAPPAGHELT
jgi:hypothetical protein